MRIRFALLSALGAATLAMTPAPAGAQSSEPVQSMIPERRPATQAAPPAIDIPIWQVIADAFPINANASLIPAGFDTTAAQIRTNKNLTLQNGLATRPSVTGDTMVVFSSGANLRMDLVFRILPGPGNYMTVGSRASGVSRRPDGKPSGYVAATPGDGSFFGEYMAGTGEFGSQPTHPGGVWSEHIWNSARMDSAENNLFPTANNTAVVGLSPGYWAGMYHESDPKFATLGIAKNRCVMVSPAGPPNSTNIVCDGTGWGAYGAGTGSGWDGSTTTKEYTKILPDGLLTPGSHVEYFLRNSDLSSPTVFTMAPDTNFIIQPAEHSVDGHRWQEFGVLPDRWKDGAWSAADRHAAAAACMLYVDWADATGDERTWVGVADSIGATAPERYGAHNGWHARGNQDPTVNLQTVIGTADDWGVYRHGGQPGTMWDMFAIRAPQGIDGSSLASRLCTPGSGFMFGKDTKTGPTGDMLRGYYRILFALTGNLIGGGTLGPYAGKGDDDVGMLLDFANGVSGTARPRMVWFQGDAFVEGQMSGLGSHPTFPPALFGAGLVSGDYRGYAANLNDIVDLIPNAPVVTSGSRYSVSNTSNARNDVLSLSGSFGAAMAARYEDTGTGTNPKIASIYAPSSLPAPDHPAVTLLNGWRIRSMGSWKTLTSQGRLTYYLEAMTNLFGALNCSLSGGQPVGVGDQPNSAVNFLALGSANPVRGGTARITFGLARKENVELRVYDVAGRSVRTLAHRVFADGEHQVDWDGRDDGGVRVPNGVYFYQLRTPSFVSQKKVALLRN